MTKNVGEIKIGSMKLIKFEFGQSTESKICYTYEKVFWLFNGQNWASVLQRFMNMLNFMFRE